MVDSRGHCEPSLGCEAGGSGLILDKATHQPAKDHFLKEGFRTWENRLTYYVRQDWGAFPSRYDQNHNPRSRYQSVCWALCLVPTMQVDLLAAWPWECTAKGHVAFRALTRA